MVMEAEGGGGKPADIGMRFLLLAALSLTIAACSREVDASKLVERQGVYYEVNSTTPFSGTLVSYHDNGQLEEKTQLRDGLLHGKSSLFFPNGQLQDVAEFEAGKIVGVSETYHDNGQLHERTNYSDGQMDGLSERYYENGQLRETGTYAEGRKDGEWVAFFCDGSIKEWSEWKNGTQHGTSLHVYDDREEIAVRRYERGLAEGTWLTYDVNAYPNYKLTQRTEWASGLKNGYELEWSFTSGNLRKITPYKQNLENGCMGLMLNAWKYYNYKMGELLEQPCTISAEEKAALPTPSSFSDPLTFLPEELRQYATW